MSAQIQKAPGWWPSLVRVVCDDCGYTGPVRGLNDLQPGGASGELVTRRELARHVCHAEEEWS